jgi:hypothetical protein
VAISRGLNFAKVEQILKIGLDGLIQHFFIAGVQRSATMLNNNVALTVSN